jgi:hypothetical protein
MSQLNASQHLMQNLQESGNAVSEKERNDMLRRYSCSSLFCKMPFVTEPMLAAKGKVYAHVKRNTLSNMSEDEFTEYWMNAGKSTVKGGINAKRNNCQNEVKKRITNGMKTRSG